MPGIAYKRKLININGRVPFTPPVSAQEELDGILAQDMETTFNPYLQTVGQQVPLGTKLIEGDRIWRYERNGAGTLTPSMVLQGALIQNAAAVVDIVVDAASAAGAYTVSLTSQAAIAVAKDYYKDGYLFINDEAGEGLTYRIKTHDALVGTTAGSIFTLYDPIITALTTSSQVGLRKNLYDYVIVAAAPLTNAPVGIAPIDVTAAYYFWAQTGGPCAVNAHAAITVGQHVYAGTTAGKSDPAITDVKALNCIGWAMTAGAADGEKHLVFLTIDR
jgi:hypothetical protein